MRGGGLQIKGRRPRVSGKARASAKGKKKRGKEKFYFVLLEFRRVGQLQALQEWQVRGGR